MPFNWAAWKSAVRFIAPHALKLAATLRGEA
jgi:hypothetical protein